jgi:hypothetical protein
MPRVFVSATIFMIVLGLAELPARAQISSDARSKSLRVAQNLSPTQQEEQRAGKPLSKAEQVALKQAIVACKAEAKGKKVRWLSRRKYVRTCVQQALKDSPNIDIIRALKDHPDMKGLPTEEAPGL